MSQSMVVMDLDVILWSVDVNKLQAGHLPIFPPSISNVHVRFEWFSL